MRDSNVWDWLEDWEHDQVLELEAAIDRLDNERLVLVAKRRTFYQRGQAKKTGKWQWRRTPAS